MVVFRQLVAPPWQIAQIVFVWSFSPNHCVETPNTFAKTLGATRYGSFRWVCAPGFSAVRSAECDTFEAVARNARAFFGCPGSIWKCCERRLKNRRT
jgi:hypothetical protein